MRHLRVPLGECLEEEKDMKKRFSKAMVIAELEALIDWHESNYGFKRERGWSQVQERNQDAQRAYGAYRQVLDLWEAWS